VIILIGKTCSVYKCCEICEEKLHGSFFGEGVNPYCKDCNKLLSIKKPLVFNREEVIERMENYRSMNIDKDIIINSDHKLIKLLSWKITSYRYIPKRKAIEMIEMGIAKVISNSTIYDTKNYTRSRSLRNRFFKRSEPICHYCGEVADTVDHKTPLGKGGLDVFDNMVNSCKTCNEIKKDMLYEDFIKLIKEKSIELLKGKHLSNVDVSKIKECKVKERKIKGYNKNGIPFYE
jgi:5-methylcytosine-specific restriction endonuclease McrA